MRKPYIKVYHGDWKADPAVQQSSLAAQAVWLYMLFRLTEEGPNSGWLVKANGEVPHTPMEIARVIGVPGQPLEDVAAAIQELEDNGAFSRISEDDVTRGYVILDERKWEKDQAPSAIWPIDELPFAGVFAGVFASAAGTVFSRRAVREARLSLIRSQSGKAKRKQKEARNSQADQQPDLFDASKPRANAPANGEANRSSSAPANAGSGSGSGSESPDLQISEEAEALVGETSKPPEPGGPPAPERHLTRPAAAPPPMASDPPAPMASSPPTPLAAAPPSLAAEGAFGSVNYVDLADELAELLSDLANPDVRDPPLAFGLLPVRRMTERHRNAVKTAICNAQIAVPPVPAHQVAAELREAFRTAATRDFCCGRSGDAPARWDFLRVVRHYETLINNGYPNSGPPAHGGKTKAEQRREDEIRARLQRAKDHGFDFGLTNDQAPPVMVIDQPRVRGTS